MYSRLMHCSSALMLAGVLGFKIGQLSVFKKTQLQDEILQLFFLNTHNPKETGNSVETIASLISSLLCSSSWFLFSLLQVQAICL